jgi:hypothetical protein
MGRKGSVEKLTQVERDAVLCMFSNGFTDAEVSTGFVAKFNKPLTKSSLQRWRKKSGETALGFHEMTRAIAGSVVKGLKLEPETDKYSLIIGNVEDLILTAGQRFYAENPLKLLVARQDDERIKLRREQLDINREKLSFDRERYEREASVQVDRLAIAAEVWKYLLIWFSANEPHLADALTGKSSEFLTDLEEHLGNQNS